MKIIIATGKNFSDYDLLKNTCDKMLSNQSEVEVVVGNADSYELSRKYAEDKKYQVKNCSIFIQLTEYADAMIVFWDGIDKSTLQMINVAKNARLKIKTIRYDPILVEPEPTEPEPTGPESTCIKLDEFFRLETDTNQWTLVYEKIGAINPKTDKPTVSHNKWHCSGLKSALDRYTNEATKISKDAKELLGSLIKIEKLIEKIEK